MDNQSKKSPVENVIDIIRSLRNIKEEAPVNNVGGGHIAGVGVGPQGEPGVDLRKKKQRNWNPFFKDMARVIRRNSKKNGK